MSTGSWDADSHLHNLHSKAPHSARTPTAPSQMLTSSPCIAAVCRVQIAVDVFAFPSQYMDLASLGVLCKYTCGQLYMYPSFNAGGQDVPKLRHELDHNLTRTTGEYII